MLTVYAFSTENWGRPPEEVDALMALLWETIRSDLERLHHNGVRLRHIGRFEGLSADIQRAIRHMEDLTKDNTSLTLNVCFNYGGRAEIVDAVRAIVSDGIPAEQITEELIERYLYTSGLPDPDLVIRTAGEMRLSNYLIWQVAYAEYYSTPTLWPDFGHDDFVAALDAYAQRKRRFGKTDAQIAAEQEEQAGGAASVSPSTTTSASSPSSTQPAVKSAR
jgi:undecaprenyl diphosphate synthase